VTKPNPAYAGDDPYVFVSYSHADSAEVDGEISWLQAQGYNVWWDEGIGGGSRWRDELAERIRQCSLFVFYVSDDSVASQVCREETEYALSQGKAIVVVYLYSTALPEGLELALANRQALMRHSMSSNDYERKLLATLAEPLGEPAAREGTRLRRYRRRLVTVPSALTLVVAVAAASVLATLQLSKPKPEPLAASGRFAVQLGGPLSFSGAGSTYLTINGAGDRLYAIGSTTYPDKTVYTRSLDEWRFEPIEGTNLDRALVGVFPSHDGQTLALGMRDGTLSRVPVTGGTPVPILKTTNSVLRFYARWLGDETLFVADAAGLRRVDVASGDAEVLVAPGVGFPYPTSDGELLYYAAGSESGARIVAMELGNGDTHTIVEGSDPRVTPRGHLLFVRGESVWAAHLKPSRVELDGEPVRVLDGVRAVPGKLQFDVSDTGTLVYQPKFAPEMGLFWSSRDGLERQIPTRLQQIGDVRPSPDEALFAYTSGRALWLYDLETNTPTRLVESRHPLFWPVWFPDGGQLIYTEFGGGRNLYRVETISAEPTLLLDAPDTQRATDITADGRTVIVSNCRSPRVRCDIGTVSVDEPTKVELLVRSEHNEFSGTLSPGDDYLLYSTDEFGPRRLVIRPFPNVRDAYWQLPLDGCIRGEWPSEDEILAHCESGRYAVAVSTTSGLSLEEPRLLHTPAPNAFVARYSPEREQFLSVKQLNLNNTAVVVTNWFDELDRLLAADSAGQN
jgi:hypothetical protein